MSTSGSGSTTPHSEATERTALLSKTDQISKDLDVVTLRNGSSNSLMNGLKKIYRVGEREVDVEAVESGETNNPLFAGQPDMMAKMYIIFPAVSIGILLSSADQTLVVSTYARMGSELEALNNTSWIASAYFLTLTSFQPLYGKLSDIFGRKPSLLFAYAIFGIGCLFCGLARNMNELIAARAFAGIGGGGMTTVVSILFSDIIPLRKRGIWQGYVNIVYAIGASSGAPLGGILADSIGWRWAFIGQFPMCIIAALSVYFLIDLPKAEQSDWLSKLRQIDFLGAFTLIAAVFCLLLGLDRGSNVSWTSAITIACCAASLPLFTLFVFVEMKIASHPFAPGHVILDRALIASYCTNYFSLAAYMGSMFYIPLYMQAVEGLSTTAAGVRLVPAMICSVTGSILAGLYMKRTGRYFLLTMISVFISIVGTIVIFLSSGFFIKSLRGIIAGLCITAFGGGTSIVTTLLSVLANAAPEDQATATASTYLFRSLGSVTGVSVASTVVQMSLRTRLKHSLQNGEEADEIVKRVRESLDFIKTLEPGVRGLVRKCYQGATNTSFGVSIAIICCAFISCCFIKEKRLSR